MNSPRRRQRKAAERAPRKKEQWTDYGESLVFYFSVVTGTGMAAH